MSDERPIPPDLKQCQTDRPSTWPHMPSPMTLGPVTHTRCTNVPTWLATDPAGSMTLCDECREVFDGLLPKAEVTYASLGEAS